MQLRIDTAISTLQRGEKKHYCARNPNWISKLRSLKLHSNAFAEDWRHLVLRSPGKSSGKKERQSRLPTSQSYEAVIATLQDKSLQADEIEDGR